MIRKCSAAVVLISLLAACAGGAGPNEPRQSSNAAPAIGSMSVSPAFGISQLTSFTMVSSASDPDNDALTYRWSYPGGTSQGASTSAVMTSDGATTVTLTVTDARGASASSAQSITVGSMAGRWSGANHCGNFEFTFAQSGRVITGTGRALQPWCAVPVGTEFRTDPAEPGWIDAGGRVEIRYKVGPFIDAYMRGQMDTSGRRVTGGMFNSGFTGQPFTLTKQ